MRVIRYYLALFRDLPSMVKTGHGWLSLIMTTIVPVVLVLLGIRLDLLDRGNPSIGVLLLGLIAAGALTNLARLHAEKLQKDNDGLKAELASLRADVSIRPMHDDNMYGLLVENRGPLTTFSVVVRFWDIDPSHYTSSTAAARTNANVRWNRSQKNTTTLPTGAIDSFYVGSLSWLTADDKTVYERQPNLTTFYWQVHSIREDGHDELYDLSGTTEEWPDHSGIAFTVILSDTSGKTYVSQCHFGIDGVKVLSPPTRTLSV